HFPPHWLGADTTKGHCGWTASSEDAIRTSWQQVLSPRAIVERRLGRPFKQALYAAGLNALARLDSWSMVQNQTTMKSDESPGHSAQVSSVKTPTTIIS